MAGNNTTSLALLSLLLLSGILHLETIKLGSGCKEVERKALLQFKQKLTDPSGRLSSWAGKACCSWRGVSCNNKTGSVIKLKLNNPFRENFDAYENDAVHELGGELSPSLLHLKGLEYLDLSMNKFEGFQVPEFMGSLKQLRYLNLSGSFFSGNIPRSLGNLSNLIYLDLNNFLDQSNQIDLEWLSGLSSLKYVNLGGADLSKAAAYWFEFFNKLHSLVELHLPNCNLPSLPLNPSLNFTSLQVLELSNNGFNSKIPHWLFNITSLVSLDLNTNDLQGDIPDGFARLNSLQQLDLTGNSFLGGRLSRNLGKLCNLRTLKLSRNSISGELIDFIDGLLECTNSSLLEGLELGFNQLTGHLPISLGYLKNIRYLVLWQNSFLGSIPPSIGNLTFLKELYLSSNLMHGNFPTSFGQLSELEMLDLSDNEWEGVITEAHFRNLSNLKELSLNKESANISLIFNISSDWIPPFKLTFINVRSCQLGPKFPAWLRNQTELTNLILNNVRISDTIPDWFWQLDLTLDYLDFSYNELSGRIPNSLRFRFPGTVELTSNRFKGPLPLWSSNVTKLSLADNLFSGPIPRDIGQKLPFLTDIDISFNFLNGSIPRSIGNLQQLLTLAMSNNNLSGEIPQFWNKLSTPYVVDMSNNSLSGEIPESIGSVLSLRFLVLCNNYLSGEIPPSLKNCSIMESLDLGDNKLSGHIPAWIGESMPSLSILRLRSNFFYGTIPSELCRLSALHILDLSQNNLSGSIPHCVGNFSSMKMEPPDSVQFEGSLQVVIKGNEYVYYSTLYLVNLLDLSSNNLSGEVPVELTTLVYLGTLNLSRNHLMGKIPTLIGKLDWLETLDLSRNKLSGSIPPSMASLRFLNFLNLSYNSLSGEIPRANQFQTLNDPSIYEGNPALCGDPLPQKCSETGGTAQVPGGDDDEEDGDEHDKLWLGLSIALGFIVGFWGVCGTLVFKSSWRYAYFQFVDKMKDRFLIFVASNAARLQRKLVELKNGSGQT